MNQAPSPNSRPLKIVRWAVGILLLAVLICCLKPLVLSRHMHEVVGKSIVEADARLRRHTNTIDPEDVRTWALELIQLQASDKVAADSRPDYIRNLYSGPRDILVSESCVSLIWGGRLFHWAYYIGNTNEIKPFHSDNSQTSYNFEWKPGIYYTRETKRGLQ